MATNQFAGPVNFLVFVFDEHHDLGPGLVSVVDRVNQGIIELLDIELIALASNGSPTKRSFC